MTDYSEPLLAARKALANAEACALLRDFVRAVEELDRASVAINRCAAAMMREG